MLKYQFKFEFFLDYCLKSDLSPLIQDFLIEEYLEFIIKEKYDPYRISNDLIVLLKFIADHDDREFIENVVNIENITSLKTCYSYQFIQIQTFYNFFSFSLNLLGCCTAQQSEFRLKHTGHDVFVKNIDRFYNFLFSFMMKTMGFGIVINRTEILYCFARFLHESDDSVEDMLSKQFMKKCLKTYFNPIKYSFDLQKFHTKFNQTYSKKNIKASQNFKYKQKIQAKDEV